jgi:transketolase
MRHFPDEPRRAGADRVVESIGHISPAVYSVLAEYGYFDGDDFVSEFRRAGSAWSGHVEQVVPGVEWNTGNLGQGLSVACGIALAEKNRKSGARTFCLMGDGEQQKGQVAEARRFAAQYGQKDLIGIIDRNHLQICGSTEDVMRVRVREEYAASGWNVVYVADGNDFQQVYKGLRRAMLHEDMEQERPVVVVMRTVMGKGISFMENLAKYHGSPLSLEDARRAMTELRLDPSIVDEALERRKNHTVMPVGHDRIKVKYPDIDPGEPILYDADKVTDCRSAYGNALQSLAEINNRDGLCRIAGFSCDLEGSVKMGGFREVSPEFYYEAGIQEHHAATCAGAMSREGCAAFFSTFGVFAACETYNQHRLNDQNFTNIKVVATHVGLDVGEDGPTHQCIDHLALFDNLFGFSIFMPADPNQTDRIIRYVASVPGNCFVGMGRSRMKMILDSDGKPFFGTDYRFKPGRADWLRHGDDCTIVTCGAVVHNVLEAADILAGMGVRAGVLNMASLKPFDVEAVLKAAETGPLITVEDHCVDTGLGAMTARALLTSGAGVKMKMLGVTGYGASGKPADLYRMQGLDAEGVAASVKDFV